MLPTSGGGAREFSDKLKMSSQRLASGEGLKERRELARHCFGCGSHNLYGLNLVFRPVDGRVETEFTPRPEHQGFPGVLHGGITATILDEAMGWAAYALGTLAFTAKMEAKFRQPISIDTPLKVIGELVKEKGRLLQARAEIRSQGGELLAEAEGVFIRMDEATAQEIERLGIGSSDPPLQGST